MPQAEKGWLAGVGAQYESEIVYKQLRKELRPKIAEKPNKRIKKINKVVTVLQERFGKVYHEQILPQLANEGIHLLKENDFNTSQQKFIDTYFKENIQQQLEVFWLDKSIPFLEDKGLYLFGQVKDQFCMISIPSGISRFIKAGHSEDQMNVTFLDNVIRYKLPDIVGQVDSEFWSIKMTRDAELYLEEDNLTQELVEQIRTHLDYRKDGLPTRLLYDAAMPAAYIEQLAMIFDLNDADLIEGGRYHNFNDFFGFPEPENKPHLFYKAFPPVKHPELSVQESLVDYLKTRETLISVPYQSFNDVLRLMDESAEHPDVNEISITLYRLSRTSKVAASLLKATQNGKKVTVFIEAKARFDEANNIYWGDKLKQAGATVLYSIPNLKVHSKIMLIEGNGFSISYIGTGNFNEKNAKIYTDFFFITPDLQVAKDLKQVFAFLLGKTTKPRATTIWLSPFNTRNKIYEHIDKEIASAKKGQKSGIFLKMNSLEDEGIIQKLYEAASAGVPIKLLVRGICCVDLREFPEENPPEIRSIVDRFLEHARVYQFYSQGKETLYIASADCMSRNLDRRIEVGIQIQNPKIKTIIQDYMNIHWSDNQKARIIDAKQSNSMVSNNSKPLRAQYALYNYFKELK